MTYIQNNVSFEKAVTELNEISLRICSLKMTGIYINPGVK